MVYKESVASALSRVNVGDTVLVLEKWRRRNEPPSSAVVSKLGRRWISVCGMRERFDKDTGRGEYGSRLLTREIAELFYRSRALVRDAFQITTRGRAAIGLGRLGLDDDTKKRIEDEIAMMLHAHRDCLRLKGVDTTHIRFDVTDVYYGEAFGIMRALRALGYGNFGAVNDESTLSHWMAQIEDRVLKEEGYGGDGVCEHCRERYGRDDALVRAKSSAAGAALNA